MASQQGITAGKLLLAGSGALLLWSGFSGKKLSLVIKDLIAGKSPLKAASNPITNPAGIYPTPSGGNTTAPIGTSAPGGYSNAQLRSLWVLAGGDPSKAAVAACIAQHESSGQAGVTSSNPDGGTNVGLWQLDTPGGVGAGYSIEELKNPLLNARVAVKGSANGTNWSDWATASSCGV